jgi:hypothetical protein
VERGDSGLGRDAYGMPRRRRLGERRAFRAGGGAAGTGARGTDGANGLDGLGDAEDDEYYGQLLRRPGDRPPYQSRPRQPAGPRTQQPGSPRRQQPGRFAPSAGQPGRGYPPNGEPAGAYPGNSDPAGGYPGNGEPAGGYPRNGYVPGGNPGRGYPGSGNPGGGYGPSGTAADGGPGNSGPRNGGPGSGGPGNGGPTGRRQYRLANGRRLPPGADRLYHPSAPGSAGGAGGRPGPGQGPDPLGGAWGRPGRPAAAPGTPPGAGGGYGGARPDGGSGWEHLRVPSAGRGVPISAEPLATPGPAGSAGSAGPLIRQRESALPDERPTDAAQPVASIAPDGLDSFARDLRALRAKSELDYPEMAEASHYTMKTLASAAGGLRLPTLPVAVAYVRACGGNVAEWEDRWQKLAAEITADAKKRRADGDDHQGLPEPADPPASPEPPALPAAQDPDPASGEVYVITSARPRQPDW